MGERLSARLLLAEEEAARARRFYEEECSCEGEHCRHWKDWIVKAADAGKLRARFDAGER